MSDDGDGEPMLDAGPFRVLHRLGTEPGEAEDVEMGAVRPEADDLEVGVEWGNPAIGRRRPGDREDDRFTAASLSAEVDLDVGRLVVGRGRHLGRQEGRLVSPGLDHQSLEEGRRHEVGEGPDDGVERQIDPNEIVNGEASPLTVGMDETKRVNGILIHDLTIPERTVAE